jgi:hypothetical protein
MVVENSISGKVWAGGKMPAVLCKKSEPLRFRHCITKKDPIDALCRCRQWPLVWAGITGEHWTLRRHAAKATGLPYEK